MRTILASQTITIPENGESEYTSPAISVCELPSVGMMHSGVDCTLSLSIIVRVVAEIV